MHEAVRSYVRAEVRRSYASVLEVGSLDINGGVRDLLDPEAEYTGIDVQQGPGVDVVADFATYRHPEPVDLILCLEVLEHTPKWREIIASAARNLAAEGELILTCATTGRAPHSARGVGPIGQDEFYQNVTVEELTDELQKHFGKSSTEVVGTDLRGRAGSPITPQYSVIIPSCSDEKVIDCVYSLAEMHPELSLDQIVVVSDGLSMPTRGPIISVRWREGKKPFVFAEAINAGVRAAIPGSDIVILGDDVRFETSHGLGALSRASVGAAIVVPEVIGCCGQPAQQKGATRATADWLAFICAYIPRHAWEAVGELDERFVGYGYDDVDWCRRARGYGELKVDHSVTVRHLPQSSFRSQPGWATGYRENRALYDAKWAEHAPVQAVSP